MLKCVCNTGLLPKPYREAVMQVFGFDFKIGLVIVNMEGERGWWEGEFGD